MDESSLPQWLPYAALVAGLLVLTPLTMVIFKGRKFRDGEVFTASRLTRGNRIFPTQVAITPGAVVQCKPRWFGREEQSIHIGQVASVTITTGMLFSDVIIETSGGSEPILCHGHTKADAARMKELIETMQDQRLRGTTVGQAGDSAAGPTKVCPFCAETIKAQAVVCRYCGRDQPAVRA